MKESKIDKFFLSIVFILLFFGFAMFISASLGIFAKNKQIFYGILFSQIALGFGLGFLGMYITFKIDYKFWRKHALLIFLSSIILTSLVYIPSLGKSHGGALRWIDLGSISFQPVEFLKFAFVIYFASWLSWAKNKVQDIKFGILPLIIMLGLIALILLKQPDTKSFILIAITGIFMLFISGVPLKYISIFSFLLIIGLSILIFFTPYLQQRIKTFINPSLDPRGASYQVWQSQIALGSGGIWGRGYGKSVQKFGYLPESQGDFIFAIIGEELGFIGTIFTIFLYCIFALKGFRIANNSPNLFSRLLVAGIVILITMQTFLHIASVVGVFPLTGVPLPFISHGGTSLAIYLTALGIILQISKYQKIN